MDNLITQFGIFGSIASIIALPLTVYSIIITLLAFKKYKPKFILQHNKVITDNLSKYEGLVVFYNNLPVNNLTISYLIFWNSGNKTLKFQDIAKSDKLRICFNGGYVFSAETVFETHTTCQLRSDIIDNSAYINFDFLDNRQGGIIKIIHTKKEINEINLYGSFMGFGSVKLNKSPGIVNFENAKGSINGLYFLTILLALLMILFAIDHNVVGENSISVLFFLFAVIIVNLSLIFIMKYFQIPKRIIKYLADNPI